MPRNLIPSEATIRAVRAEDGCKRLADGDGLVLLLFATRGAHSWRLDYRFHGKRKEALTGGASA